MLNKNEILELLKCRRWKTGLTPRTEIFINNNKELKESILLLTNNITDTTLCDRVKYLQDDRNENNKCICGKYITIKKQYCSAKCSSNDELIREKYKQTCLEKYGTDNASKSDITKKIISDKNKANYKDRKEEILAKRYETNIITYGASGALSNPICLEKYKQTSIDRVGVDNVFRLYSFKENLRQYKLDNPELMKISRLKTTVSKFKLDYNSGFYHHKTYIPLFTEEDWHLEINQRQYKCLTCDTEYYQHSDNIKRCLLCQPLRKTYAEIELVELIKGCGVSNIEENTRKIITPKELDIYLPDQKLAIEFNGLIFHSYGYGSNSLTNNSEREDINRHLNKTKSCNTLDIQLLHIFDNEWLDLTKRSIWESIIKSKLGANISIGARKCKIKEVSFQDSKNFLYLNHLQGNSQSSIRLGLYYQEELVSLLTIMKSRFNKNYDWEITRYCNKLGTNVIGGFSKLLKRFRLENEGSVITYADKRYSTGDMYSKAGFTELKDSTPNYFYFIDKKYELYSRIKFQKHKLKDILPIFDESKSESENMFMNGYRRIWDCGNKVFVLHK